MALSLLQPVGYDAHSCGYCSPPGERSRKRGSRSFGCKSLWAEGSVGSQMGGWGGVRRGASGLSWARLAMPFARGVPPSLSLVKQPPWSCEMLTAVIAEQMSPEVGTGLRSWLTKVLPEAHRSRMETVGGVYVSVSARSFLPSYIPPLPLSVFVLDTAQHLASAPLSRSHQPRHGAHVLPAIHDPSESRSLQAITTTTLLAEPLEPIPKRAGGGAEEACQGEAI